MAVFSMPFSKSEEIMGINGEVPINLGKRENSIYNRLMSFLEVVDEDHQSV
jgi:hypothetical protein